MKAFISTVAIALALAVTGPAFAGDVSKATDKASCDKAGGNWDDTARSAQRKCKRYTVPIGDKGARFGGPLFYSQSPGNRTAKNPTSSALWPRRSAAAPSVPSCLLLWHMTRDEFLVRDFLQNWLFPAYNAGAFRIGSDEVEFTLRV